MWKVYRNVCKKSRKSGEQRWCHGPDLSCDIKVGFFRVCVVHLDVFGNATLKDNHIASPTKLGGDCQN